MEIGLWHEYYLFCVLPVRHQAIAYAIQAVFHNKIVRRIK